MPANPTDAEAALSRLFQTKSAQFTERPLDKVRASAFERFAAAGLPHRRVEAYKYTDLRTRLKDLPPAAAEAAEADVKAMLDTHAPVQEGAHRIVIANGRFVPNLSSAPANVTVHSLLDPAADTGAVGELVKDSDDPLTLANTSLFDGGAVIHVSGIADAPMEIVHIATGDELVMGRVAMFVVPEGRAAVIERMFGKPGTVDNAMTELTLGARAHADWIRLAEGAGETAVSLSSLHVKLAEKAELEHLTVTTGTGLARNQIFAHVAGDEAQANFRAATVGVGKRHADNTLVIRHSALHSGSSMIFRSAVGDRATAIVQGRIIVDPGAQKTDAKMMSNALFLDRTGEVVNKPELEIFADDVVCGHGATAGDLDEDGVFYLRARGIPETTARRLLVEAYVVEALERIEDETLHEALRQRLAAALEVMGGQSWS